MNFQNSVARMKCVLSELALLLSPMFRTVIRFELKIDWVETDYELAFRLYVDYKILLIVVRYRYCISEGRT
jgi:hypothetical protein